MHHTSITTHTYSIHVIAKRFKTTRISSLVLSFYPGALGEIFWSGMHRSKFFRNPHEQRWVVLSVLSRGFFNWHAGVKYVKCPFLVKQFPLTPLTCQIGRFKLSDSSFFGSTRRIQLRRDTVPTVSRSNVGQNGGATAGQKNGGAPVQKCDGARSQGHKVSWWHGDMVYHENTVPSGNLT